VSAAGGQKTDAERPYRFFHKRGLAGKDHLHGGEAKAADRVHAFTADRGFPAGETKPFLAGIGPAEAAKIVDDFRAILSSYFECLRFRQALPSLCLAALLYHAHHACSMNKKDGQNMAAKRRGVKGQAGARAVDADAPEPYNTRSRAGVTPDGISVWTGLWEPCAARRRIIHQGVERMPVYAFECKKCAHAFELKLSMKEREGAAVACPECGSEDCGQLFDRVNVGVKSTAGKTPSEFGCDCCDSSCCRR